MLKSESLVTVPKIWYRDQEERKEERDYEEIRKKLGRELSFLIDLHCSVKESLSRFALPTNELQIRYLQ